VKDADPAAAMRSYHEWQIHRMESTAARRSCPAIAMAEIYAGAGRTDQALEWLERSYRAREARLVFLVASPDLATLRNDPRFIDLARRVGVPLPPHS